MLNEDKKNFREEETQLLKTVLKWRFFDPWSYDYGDQYSIKNDANLELYLTNGCNQHCEYCYLTKYAGLYPEGTPSPELVLKNLQIIYDWIVKNDYVIPKVEFFSGEIWHTKLGWDVLALTLDYIQNKNLRIGFFLIASNFSFIFDEVARNKIHYYVERFNECGKQLVFSCSCDGAVVENESRPTNNGQIRDEKYWHDLFEFCKVHHLWFHPMISANNVHQWIENYDWWTEQCKKWGFPIKRAVNLLEVRNDNWTPESIKDYCNFLKHMIDIYWDECNHDVSTYARRILHIRGEMEPVNEELFESGYCPVGFGQVDTFLGCTVCTDLTIRVGDLAICPCHRQAYNPYLYGRFITENDEIVDIEAINPEMAVKILMGNLLLCEHGCDTCIFNNCCIHGCYGSQLESTGDPFFPIESVCNMLKAKHAFLLQQYEDMGIIDYLKTITPYEKDYDDVRRILKVYELWVQEGKPYALASIK